MRGGHNRPTTCPSQKLTPGAATDTRRSYSGLTGFHLCRLLALATLLGFGEKGFMRLDEVERSTDLLDGGDDRVDRQP